MTTNKYLPGITRDELKTIIKELGEPSYRANQIAEHIYRHRVTDPDKMSNLPQNLRGKLKELLNQPLLMENIIDVDGVKCYLKLICLVLAGYMRKT